MPQTVLEAIEDESETTQTILEIIKTLPQDLSSIVSLIYFSGFTQAQTAVMLKLSIASVNRKNKEAMEIIKKALLT